MDFQRIPNQNGHSDARQLYPCFHCLNRFRVSQWGQNLYEVELQILIDVWVPYLLNCNPLLITNHSCLFNKHLNFTKSVWLENWFRGTLCSFNIESRNVQIFLSIITVSLTLPTPSLF